MNLRVHIRLCTLAVLGVPDVVKRSGCALSFNVMHHVLHLRGACNDDEKVFVVSSPIYNGKG
jgi:hypothetical protein